jgi:hypothetical protein
MLTNERIARQKPGCLATVPPRVAIDISLRRLPARHKALLGETPSACGWAYGWYPVIVWPATWRHPPVSSPGTGHPAGHG